MCLCSKGMDKDGNLGGGLAWVEGRTAKGLRTGGRGPASSWAVMASCSSVDRSGQGFWRAEELAMVFSGYWGVSALLNTESLR